MYFIWLSILTSFSCSDYTAVCGLCSPEGISVVATGTSGVVSGFVVMGSSGIGGSVGGRCVCVCVCVC